MLVVDGQVSQGAAQQSACCCHPSAASCSCQRSAHPLMPAHRRPPPPAQGCVVLSLGRAALAAPFERALDKGSDQLAHALGWLADAQLATVRLAGIEDQAQGYASVLLSVAFLPGVYAATAVSEEVRALLWAVRCKLGWEGGREGGRHCIGGTQSQSGVCMASIVLGFRDAPCTALRRGEGESKRPPQAAAGALLWPPPCAPTPACSAWRPQQYAARRVRCPLHSLRADVGQRGCGAAALPRGGAEGARATAAGAAGCAAGGS